MLASCLQSSRGPNGTNPAAVLSFFSPSCQHGAHLDSAAVHLRSSSLSGFHSALQVYNKLRDAQQISMKLNGFRGVQSNPALCM